MQELVPNVRAAKETKIELVTANGGGYQTHNETGNQPDNQPD